MGLYVLGSEGDGFKELRAARGGRFSCYNKGDGNGEAYRDVRGEAGAPRRKPPHYGLGAFSMANTEATLASSSRMVVDHLAM